MGSNAEEAGRLRDHEVVERLRRTLPERDLDILTATESLVHLLKTYSAVYDALHESLAPFNLSVAQYNLIVILHKAPEHRLQMSEIGERMSVTRTNITKLVDCLEREGLVRRTDQPGDRRVVLAELTPKGQALVQRVLPEHFANVRALWAQMAPEECLQLTHLLLKLRRSVLAAVAADRPHAAGRDQATPRDGTAHDAAPPWAECQTVQHQMAPHQTAPHHRAVDRSVAGHTKADQTDADQKGCRAE